MQREPVHCLPYPWPRPEPEPEPGDLGQYVNWRTYSHRELYDMATTGLDLEGATEVAAQWSRLGGELDEIGQELRKALREAADGWQGASAEEARGKVEQLAGWTEESAAGSAVVSGCVSEQAALAATAKRNMPEPPPAVEVFLPTPQVPQEYWRTAPDLVADPAPEREESRQLHQQAAEVMEQYQRDSNELYGRVPAFQSPDPESLLLREPDPPPPPPREPGPKPEPAPDDGTTASSVSPVAPVAGGTSAPGSPGGGTVTPMTPGQQSGGEQPGAGPRAGAAAPSGQAAPPAAAATAGPRGGAVPGAMPMGAAAGARPGGDDDVERKSPSYLQEEDDLWGPQVPVVPPVLGEGPRGGW